MRMSVKMFVLTVIVLGLITLAGGTVDASTQTTEHSETVKRVLTASTGAEYEIWLNTSSHTLWIKGENPTERTVYAGVVVEVDGTRLNSTEIKLRPNHSWESEYRFHKDLDALEDQHTVIVSTFGDYTTFTFTYDVDPEQPNGVEVPRITDVSVGNAMIDGQSSSVVNVTVVNPSIQTYPTKLMVHTQGTDGSLYPAIVPPGETETVTVELLDDQNTKIAGEARLYTGDFNDPEGGIHQVGFVGRAGGTTTMWNESFEPVAAPWSDDPYEYHNASIDPTDTLAERASGGVEVGGVPVALPIVALLAGGFIVWRMG